MNEVVKVEPNQEHGKDKQLQDYIPTSPLAQPSNRSFGHEWPTEADEDYEFIGIDGPSFFHSKKNAKIREKHATMMRVVKAKLRASSSEWSGAECSYIILLNYVVRVLSNLYQKLLN